MNYFETPLTSAHEKSGIFEKPFEIIPDYRYLYLPTNRIIALDKIMELMESRAKNIVITGESGSGKTTLARRIEFKLNLCHNHYPLFIDVNNNLHSVEFWKMLVKHFNLRISEKPEKNQKTILDFLEQNSGIVNLDLIIDNTELTNYDLETTLIELDDFRYNGIRLFHEILFMTIQEDPTKSNNSYPKFRLERFDFSETRKMIEYRLFISGSPQLFSEKAIERIFEFTQGNPREVVNLCRESLDYLSRNGYTFIDEIDIEKIKLFMNFSST